MKNKIIVLLIGICLIFGLLSGCTQQEEVKETLEAIFEYNPTENIYVNVTVTFNDKSTGEDIESWLWDFGDGIKSNSEDSVHKYEGIGTYIVTLTIIDKNGDTSNTSKTIDITYKPPTAKFNHPTDELWVNTELNFTDASIPGDANITNWEWDFDDGTALSVLQNPPAHTYAVEKQYDVSLTVTDGNGLTDTISVRLSIGRPPQ